MMRTIPILSGLSLLGGLCLYMTCVPHMQGTRHSAENEASRAASAAAKHAQLRQWCDPAKGGVLSFVSSRHRGTLYSCTYGSGAKEAS